ncbi:MAG: aldo/keto reductase [Paludibacter sp.]
MQTAKFDNLDEIPILGLGTWLSKGNEVYVAVLEAIRIGYRHFDCAYIYRNEKEIGRALKDAMTAGLVKREELFITSKLWNSDHAPDRVEVAVRKSLHDLQLDYLDLYLMHWPVAFKTKHEMANDASDLVSLDQMPLHVTWQAMEAIKLKGLTRHIGVSNFNIPKLKYLIDRAVVKPEVNQVELHPYFQQLELVEFCKFNGILVTAYSPLGSRHLMNSEAGLTQEKLILEIAKKHSCTVAQVLLAWGMQRGTIVIPKSIHFERIKENFESIYVNMNSTEIAEIDILERNLRMAKGAYCVLPNGCYTLKSIWEE